MRGIVVGEDDLIANWAWKEFNLFPLVYCRAIGIIEDGKIVGAAIFSHYNGCDAHLSYYGKNTLSSGVIRSLAAVAIHDLGLTRVTLIIPKKSKRLLRALPKYGFKLEGTQRCYYGAHDCSRNTGVRFVMFREQIEKLIHNPKSSVAKLC